MDKNKINFFECLGEVWRDITAIEFLMRCAIAVKEGEIDKLPKPPFTKGKIYTDYPKSFSHHGFGDVVADFNKLYPHLMFPQEIIQLRNAMAHGIIAEVDNSGVTELVKYKESSKMKGLVIEFSMPLEPIRLAQIRQSIKELRGYIMKEVDEKRT